MDSPEPHSLRLITPEHDFRLDAVERGKVVSGFDVEALERLLGMVRPDMRGDILQHFQAPEEGVRARGALTEFFDPVLQEVLEEVWAPMWEGASDEELTSREKPYYFPGREVARLRREEHRRLQQQSVKLPE